MTLLLSSWGRLFRHR